MSNVKIEVVDCCPECQEMEIASITRSSDVSICSNCGFMWRENSTGHIHEVTEDELTPAERAAL